MTVRTIFFRVSFLTAFLVLAFLTQKHLVRGALLNLVAPQAVALEDMSGGQLARAIEYILHQPLPSVPEILPGYERPKSIPPSLIVGDFTYESDDEVVWGGNLANLFRWKVTYAPDPLFVTSDIRKWVWWEDLASPEIPAEGISLSVESLRFARQRLGIERGVTGHVEVFASTYALRITLHDLTSTTAEEIVHRFSGAKEELPNALVDAAQAIHADMGVVLDEESSKYLETSSPTTFESLRDYLELATEINGASRGKDWEERLFAFLDRGENVPPAAHLWRNTVKQGKGEEYPPFLEKLESFGKRYPQDAGVAHLIPGCMYDGSDEPSFKRQIERLKDRIAEYPHDPMAFMQIASKHTDLKDYLTALALFSEGVERWPGHYRLWWGLTHCLEKQAWADRGNEYADKVTSQGWRSFKGLRILAAQTGEKTLELNPECGSIRWTLMNIHGAQDGGGDLFFKHFEETVRFYPNRPDFYGSAYNYTMGRWGGTADHQRRIYKASLDHNPDEIWPHEKYLGQLRDRFKIYDSDFRVPGKKLLELSREASVAAKIVAAATGRGMSSCDWDVLFTLIRSGSADEGLKMIRKISSNFVPEEDHDDHNPYTNLYCMAKCAAGFGDYDLAEDLAKKIDQGDFAELDERKERLAIMREKKRHLDLDEGTLEGKLNEAFANLPANAYERIMLLEVCIEKGIKPKIFPKGLESAMNAVADGKAMNRDEREEMAAWNALVLEGREHDGDSTIHDTIGNLILGHYWALAGRSEKAETRYRSAWYYQMEADDEDKWYRWEPFALAPFYRQLRENAEASVK